jgi:hypothetical protein
VTLDANKALIRRLFEEVLPAETLWQHAPCSPRNSSTIKS